MEANAAHAILYDECRETVGQIAGLDPLTQGIDAYIVQKFFVVAFSAYPAQLRLFFLLSQKQLPELRNHRQRAHTGFGLGGIGGYCDGLSVFFDLRDGVVDLTAEEAGEAQETTTEEIIKSATEQALQILKEMNADRESFRKVGLTFEEKAFYDILMSLRDQYNFEYGEDKVVNGVMVNEKCKTLAKKIKEIIDTKSSFADWLNNQIVRDQLKFDIKICLVKNGYPPQYSPEVFRKVMEQVENFEENN